MDGGSHVWGFLALIFFFLGEAALGRGEEESEEPDIYLSLCAWPATSPLLYSLVMCPHHGPAQCHQPDDLPVTEITGTSWKWAGAVLCGL